MSDTRVTVLLAPDEPPLPGLKALNGLARVRQLQGDDGLAEALADTDVLVVTDFRVEALEAAWPDPCPIRWVHATSAGVDALMIPPIRDGDFPVTNAAGLFDRGIAEYVLGAVLLFAKDTLTNLSRQRQRRWDHRETALIRGARALVVGAGSIGREVATLLGAVGMEVVGTARRPRDHDPAFSRVHGQEDLPELLGEADYVIVTAPLTPDTEGLFDHHHFHLMKPGAVFINVGRGAIVRTTALMDALDGHLAGAALDVFEQEPLPADHPLWGFDNVMLSAHMAGDFTGWRRALGEQFVDNFNRWRLGEPLANPVDTARGYGRR